MKAILIDPERRKIEAIELPDDDAAIAEAMRCVIGCTDMDYGLIDDMRDTIWVDGSGLKNQRPIEAFKLHGFQRNPYAGKAIIIGAEEGGKTCAPFIPIEILRADIVWLGVIVPQVDWLDEPHGGLRAVVTYSRRRQS